MQERIWISTPWSQTSSTKITAFTPIIPAPIFIYFIDDDGLARVISKHSSNFYLHLSTSSIKRSLPIASQHQAFISLRNNSQVLACSSNISASYVHILHQDSITSRLGSLSDSFPSPPQRGIQLITQKAVETTSYSKSKSSEEQAGQAGRKPTA